MSVADVQVTVIDRRVDVGVVVEVVRLVTALVPGPRGATGPQGEQGNVGGQGPRGEQGDPGPALPPNELPVPTGDLSLAGHGITDLADGASATDAATVGQVAVDLAALDAALTDALTLHAGTTLDVHGIVDTADLVVTGTLAAALGAHEAAPNPHPVYDLVGSAATAQAFAVQRANHAGEQPIATVTGLQAALDAKAVDALTAHLAGAETFTGLKTFSAGALVRPSAIGAVGLTVRGLAGQTANLFEVQDSTPTMLWQIGADGTLTTLAPIQGRNTGNSRGYTLTAAGSGSAPGLLITRVDNGSGPTLQVNGSSGASSGSTLLLKNGLTTSVTAILRAEAAQTADNLQVQDSVGTVLSRFDAAGRLGIGGAPTNRLEVVAAADSEGIKVSGGTAQATLYAAGSLGRATLDLGTSSSVVIRLAANNPSFLRGSGGMTFGNNSAVAGTPNTPTVGIWSTAATSIALALRANAAQAADLFRAIDSTEAVLCTITAAGLHKWSAANVQTSVGAAGAAAALPATPSKYLKIVGDDGVTYVVPAYAAA